MARWHNKWLICFHRWEAMFACLWHPFLCLPLSLYRSSDILSFSLSFSVCCICGHWKSFTQRRYFFYGETMNVDTWQNISLSNKNVSIYPFTYIPIPCLPHCFHSVPFNHFIVFSFYYDFLSFFFVSFLSLSIPFLVQFFLTFLSPPFSSNYTFVSTSLSFLCSSCSLSLSSLLHAIPLLSALSLLFGTSSLSFVLYPFFSHSSLSFSPAYSSLSLPFIFSFLLWFKMTVACHRAGD